MSYSCTTCYRSNSSRVIEHSRSPRRFVTRCGLWPIQFIKDFPTTVLARTQVPNILASPVIALLLVKVPQDGGYCLIGEHYCIANQRLHCRPNARAKSVLLESTVLCVYYPALMEGYAL